jgi:hypothetical protein
MSCKRNPLRSHEWLNNIHPGTLTRHPSWPPSHQQLLCPDQLHLTPSPWSRKEANTVIMASLQDIYDEFERFFNEQLPPNLHDLPFRLLESVERIGNELCELTRMAMVDDVTDSSSFQLSPCKCMDRLPSPYRFRHSSRTRHRRLRLLHLRRRALSTDWRSMPMRIRTCSPATLLAAASRSLLSVSASTTP